MKVSTINSNDKFQGKSHPVNTTIAITTKRATLKSKVFQFFMRELSFKK